MLKKLLYFYLKGWINWCITICLHLNQNPHVDMFCCWWDLCSNMVFFLFEMINVWIYLIRFFRLFCPWTEVTSCLFFKVVHHCWAYFDRFLLELMNWDYDLRTLSELNWSSNCVPELLSVALELHYSLWTRWPMAQINNSGQ